MQGGIDPVARWNIPTRQERRVSSCVLAEPWSTAEPYKSVKICLGIRRALFSTSESMQRVESISCEWMDT